MKNTLKTLGLALLYDFAGCILYILLMLFFGWMSHWWWIFIILIGIGSISSITGYARIISTFPIVFTKNLLGKILAILITIHLLYISIQGVWFADFAAEHAKEITVKIIATIAFLAIYLPALFVAFIPQKD